MENNYCVYKHTNLETGKIYYGISENYLFRWNDGVGYQTNLLFWKDIIKYGWKNFKHEIIFESLTREKAKFYEGMLIQETQSYLPENGYNQNIGERMKYKEILIDSAEEELETTYQRKRNGRGGTPVFYNEKIYLTIKELCDEIDEDSVALAQMLNPNTPRKISAHLKDGGFRYATDTEIEDYYKSLS